MEGSQNFILNSVLFFGVLQPERRRWRTTLLATTRRTTTPTTRPNSILDILSNIIWDQGLGLKATDYLTFKEEEEKYPAQLYKIELKVRPKI